MHSTYYTFWATYGPQIGLETLVLNQLVLETNIHLAFLLFHMRITENINQIITIFLDFIASLISLNIVY